MKTRFQIVLILAAFALPAFFTVAAIAAQQEDNDEDFRLKTLNNNALVQVVSKREERIGQAFGVVSVINRREIELFGANNLAEVLDRVTSSYLMSTYITPDNQFSIRSDINGHFNSRVVILLNGRPTMGSSSEGIDFPIFKSFPLEAIERLEIQRGPGSVYHGSGAITGVINIVTRRPHEKHEATAVAGGGAFGNVMASFAGGKANLSEKDHPTKQQRISFYTALSYKKDEGWDPSIYANGGSQHNYFNGTTNYGGFGELLYKGFSINGFLMRSDSNSLTDPALGAVTQQELNGQKGFLNLGFQRSFFKNTVSDINVTFVEDKLEENGIEVIQSRDLFAETSLRGQFNENINYNLGFEFKYFTGGESEESLFEEYHSLHYRIYGDIEYKFTEYMKGIIGTQVSTLEGIEEDNVSPKIGLQIDLLPSISLKAVYSSGFRTPSHLEQGVRSLHEVGDELIPEEIGTFEVQALAQFDDVLFATSFFFSRHENRIFMTNDDLGGFIFYNDDKDITSSGFEFEAKVAMFPNWYFTGSFAYLQNQLETDTANLYLLNSTLSPEYIVKMGLARFVPGKYSIGLFLSKYSTPAETDTLRWDDIYNPKPQGYNWATLNFSYYLNNNFKINAYLTNFLDEKVYYPEVATRSARSIPGRSGPGAILSATLIWGSE